MSAQTASPSSIAAGDEQLTPAYVADRMANAKDRRDRIAHQAEVGDYGKDGPVTEALLHEGAKLYDQFAELKPVLPPSLNDAYLELRNDFLEPLRVCRDALQFTAEGRQLWMRSSNANKRIRNDFTLFAKNGIPALAKANKDRFQGSVDPKFADDLEKYHGICQYLEEVFFAIFLTAAGAYRAGLKKEDCEEVARRIGLKRATQIMEATMRKR